MKRFPKDDLNGQIAWLKYKIECLSCNSSNSSGGNGIYGTSNTLTENHQVASGNFDFTLNSDKDHQLIVNNNAGSSLTIGFKYNDGAGRNTDLRIGVAGGAEISETDGTATAFINTNPNLITFSANNGSGNLYNKTITGASIIDTITNGAVTNTITQDANSTKFDGGFVLADVAVFAMIGNTDNMNSAGFETASHIDIQATGSFNWTGLDAAGGAGAVPAEEGTIITFQVSGGDVTLINDASSVAANRFILAGAASIIVRDGGGGVLRYDATSSRWRLIAVNA